MPITEKEFSQGYADGEIIIIFQPEKTDNSVTIITKEKAEEFFNQYNLEMIIFWENLGSASLKVPVGQEHEWIKKFEKMKDIILYVGLSSVEPIPDKK